MRWLLAGPAVGLLLVLAPALPAAADFEGARADYYGGNYPAAIGELKALIAMGDARAETLLGIMYDRGQGVPRDDLAAALLYRSAVAKGYFPARYLLGQMYARDPTRPEDAKATFLRYQQAAEAGHAVAQFNLARAYATGLGVTADPVRALLWYRMAAEGLPAGEPAALAPSRAASVARGLSPEALRQADELLRQWKAGHR